MATTKNIKALRNIYGNWCCYIGSRKEYVTGEDFIARDWLSEKLAEGGYALSPASEITQAEIDAHRAKLA